MNNDNAQVEELEQKVALLEQEVSDMRQQLLEQNDSFQQELTLVEKDCEAAIIEVAEEAAEEAIRVGFELGYLQSTVKHAEKAAYVAKAASSFDEIMGLPSIVDADALEGIVAEMDSFIFFDDECSQDDFERAEVIQVLPEGSEDDVLESEEAESLEFEEDAFDEQSADVKSAAEVAAAIRSWVSDAVLDTEEVESEA